MSIKFSRSRSFFTLTGKQSLDELLRDARKQRSKYVVVDFGLSQEPSYCVWEQRPFFRGLAELRKQLLDLGIVPERAGEITLEQLLGSNIRDWAAMEVATTPSQSVSEHLDAIIDAGKIVLRIDEGSPLDILFPKIDLHNQLQFEVPTLSESSLESLIREIPPRGLARNIGRGPASGRRSRGQKAKPPASPEPAAISDIAPAVQAAPMFADGGSGGGGGEGNGGGNGGGDRGHEGGSGDGTPAYPNIDVSNRTPVQGTSITVTVSIDFTKPDHTAGSITLPVDDREYRIDVHLLLGEESRWEHLTFQRPQGTKEAAVFKDFKIPMLPVEDRTPVERRFYDLYANFYLLQPYKGNDGAPVQSARWCGEAVRRIEVLARDGMAATPITPPEQPEWRDYLHVAPTAPPPDLLVRVKTVSENTFHWTLLSPHRDFTQLAKEDLVSQLRPAPYFFMQDHFEPFAGKALSDDQLTDLLSQLDLIYSSTPRGFQTAYWDLRLGVGQDAAHRAPLETIQFVSDEPFIPWELMRVSDDDRAPKDKPEILALRHAVGRWVALDSSEVRQSLRVRDIAVFATDYQTVNSVTKKLPWAIKERENLERFEAQKHEVRRADVVTFLEGGTAEIVHFSCHGTMNVQEPEKAVMQLEDGNLTAPIVWRPESRRGLGKHHPFVFLNACQLGAGGQVAGLVFGWPQAFLRMGATACVAPLWSVVDESAKDVAERFYDLTLKSAADDSADKPMALGKALQQIRSLWLEKKSITYLSYVLYGDPAAILDWRGIPKPWPDASHT